MNSIEDKNLSKKNILVRVDLNVPVVNDQITDRSRIKSILPTLKKLKDSNNKIFLISHFGRPNGIKNKKYSLKFICNILEEEINIKKIYFLNDFDEKNIQNMINEINPGDICLFENIQTTNSFSLKKIVNYLFDKGCDLTIFGEPERRIKEIIKGVLENENLENIPDIAFKKNNQIVCTKHDEYDNLLDELPLPLWNKFDMSGYWKMNFSHAPVKKNSKFLPILSSRGCPFRCKFCVSPMLNPKWRKRSAKSVADEMEFFYKTMNVTDFHFSDLDPTVDEKRTAEICKQLISKNLPIEWKLAQGTKIETIKNIETLELMKKSGLTFFAFSPESGSKELMKKLNKPFDYDHALKITKHLLRKKIIKIY